MTHTATPPFTETATPTASVTSTYNSPTLTVTVTNTNVVTYNSGTASASTNPLFSGVYGNKVTITFNCGSISWQGPSPIYGTLRIIVPEGWSLPSLAGNNAGYYEVSLPSGGQLVGIDAVDRTMIIKVASLPAVTGKVAVTYGSMSSGGPGAYIPTSGNFTFDVSASEMGDSTLPIAVNPQVTVLIPTPSATPTNTPIIGEGTITVIPQYLTQNTIGNTIMLVYTAGATAWTSGADGGTIRITLPSGWTPPEGEEGYAGQFSAVASSG
ncbi:MAG TPA: hypothetical protein PKJ42_10250, partial [Candidatus Goldiibacteriota bacterium]|nr:hypothetical protein [Candidatus Goldiibacteriota bacterium]